MLGSYYMMSEGQSALALDSSPMPYVFSFIQPRFPTLRVGSHRREA